MDPPPQSPISSKLRLMCSYGGQITRRPHDKSLAYLGGETRIVAVNPTTIATLSAFISHLSATLSVKSPFTLKYQLPHLGLDSLITLSSDDDLQFMLGEHVRLSLASASSRIRLFLFCSKPETATHNVIHHPKTEAWFVDVLKSAKILQKGRDCLVGYDGEGLIGDNETKGVGDLGNGAVSLAESLVLETSSSFGSSSSSASLVNLPPIKPQDEDVGFNSLDNALKLTTPEAVATLASETITANSSSHPKTETCHGLIAHPPSVENGLVSAPVISESNFHDPAARIHAHNMIDFSYPLASPSSPFQQGLHFVPAAAPVENCLPNMFPISSYYPIQQQPQPQQQFLHYQPNHMYPLYYFPVGQSQTQPHTQVSASYNLPIQWGVQDAATVSSFPPSVPLNASLLPPQAAHMEVISEPTQHNFGPTSVENRTAMKPCDQTQQLSVIQSTDVAFGEVARNHNEFSDDPERIQIYKSQPPPPAIPSQFQKKAKPSATLLSDAMTQLQMIKIKQ